MILKIARYGHGKQKRWEFIDGIREASTFPIYLRKILREDGKTEVLRCFYDESGDEQVRMDSFSVPSPVEESVLSGEKPFCYLSGALITSRDQAGRIVVFHEGYLLNDEGKTIERL